jgi:hypothetical protein
VGGRGWGGGSRQEENGRWQNEGGAGFYGLDSPRHAGHAEASLGSWHSQLMPDRGTSRHAHAAPAAGGGHTVPSFAQCYHAPAPTPRLSPCYQGLHMAVASSIGAPSEA